MLRSPTRHSPPSCNPTAGKHLRCWQPPSHCRLGCQHHDGCQALEGVVPAIEQGRERLKLCSGTWEGGPLTLLGGRPPHSFGREALSLFWAESSQALRCFLSLPSVHPSPPIPSISQPPPLPPHGHIESFETYIPHPPLPPPSPLLLHRDVEGLEADERKRGVGGVHQSDEEELPVTAWGEDMRNWWATQIWFPCLQ